MTEVPDMDKFLRPGNPRSNADNKIDANGLNKFDAETALNVQIELAKYKKALAEEYAAAEQASTPVNVEQYTREFFKKNVGAAAAQVVFLSQNATSDSVRLNACKIIITEAMADARADGDPIRELLQSLSGT